MVNDLIVCGEAPEIDRLIGRLGEEGGDGAWKREPTVEKALERSGIGRLGVYCFSWRGGPGKPAASVLLYRRAPGELAVSSVVPSAREPLTDEEYNSILSEFAEGVLGPLSAGSGIATTIRPPRLDRLEQSLSPEALRKLNRFVSSLENRAGPSMEDLNRWDDFWYQVYSDGSLVANKDLGEWLMGEGLSQERASALLARKAVGQELTHQGSGF